ncbi:MAG TPA: patatin-like phospholipase family protein, partial [Candidatus Sulfopaludibacter sp.]|nr:patatin-like phospholipase family protein [Candidatus Sulfopaludibacter sp.]
MSVPLSTTEVLEEEAAYLRSAASADCRDARTAPAESSPPLCALCISGGGIRSATFALGALQGLAGSGLLERFDYLSTVSGGGYIGSWLTAWIHRAKGIGKVMPCLKPGGKPPKDFDPIQHLREYNNYLSPRVNITSADTWTLASTVIRNMFLNWLVLIPLLMVMLMAPRLIMSLGRLGETFDDFYGAPFPPELSAVLPLVGGFLLAMAVYNTMRYLPGIGNYQHTEADFVKFCLAPAILAALTYMTFDAWFYLDLTKLSGGAAGTHTPVLTYLMAWMIGASLTGWAAYIIRHGGSGRLKLMFSPVSLALILMGAALGGSEYVLSKYILPHVPWNPYITTAAPMLLGAFGMAAFLFVGFSSRYLKDEDREWLSRAGAWLLMFVFGWMAICSLVLNLPEVELKAGHLWQGAAAAFGGGAGWLSALGGFKARARAGVGDGKAGISAADVVAKLAAPAFVVLLLIGLAILTDTVLWYGTAFLPATGMAAVWQPKHRPAGWSQHGLLIASARWELVVAATAVFWAVAWVMARRININMFSLHGMYRSRLIRAYLGASKAVRAGRSLTGFDERDNLYMYELQDPKLRPFYVVNVTLNLVAGQRLAWQQRKAAPFTISALHCGSADLGYRP